MIRLGALRPGREADTRMRSPTVLCVSQAVATPSNLQKYQDKLKVPNSGFCRSVSNALVK